MKINIKIIVLFLITLCLSGTAKAQSNGLKWCENKALCDAWEYYSFDEEMGAGGTIIKEVVLNNDSEEEYDFSLAVVEKRGEMDFKMPADEQNYLGAWAEVEPNSIHITPGEKQRIRLITHIPVNIEDGIYEGKTVLYQDNEIYDPELTMKLKVNSKEKVVVALENKEETTKYIEPKQIGLEQNNSNWKTMEYTIVGIMFLALWLWWKSEEQKQHLVWRTDQWQNFVKTFNTDKKYHKKKKEFIRRIKKNTGKSLLKKIRPKSRQLRQKIF